MSYVFRFFDGLLPSSIIKSLIIVEAYKFGRFSASPPGFRLLVYFVLNMYGGTRGTLSAASTEPSGRSLLGVPFLVPTRGQVCRKSTLSTYIVLGV